MNRALLETGHTDFSAIKMIVTIDFGANDAAAMDRHKVSELFSELVRASVRGHHRVVINRAMCRWSIEHLDLNERQKKHVAKIGQEFSQLGGEPPAIAPKISIVAESQLPECVGMRRWVIGVDEILSGDYLEPASLILENATNDGDFYELLLRLTAKKEQIGDLSYNIHHGGGNGCAAEVTRQATHQKIVVCVCDTDLLSPFGAKSATYTSAKAAFNQVQPVGEFFGTPGREVENFLPVDVIGDISGNWKAVIEVENIVNSQKFPIAEGDCIFLYLDLKNGANPGKYDNYCKSTESRSWICQKFRVPEIQIQNLSTPAFGHRLIESVIKSEPLKRKMHRHVRSSYWDVHFSNWAQSLAWMFAGRKPDRAK